MRHFHKFSYISAERTALAAVLRGGAGYENIEGLVTVYWLPDALFLQAEFTGLPPSEVFGLHVHSGFSCGSPTSTDEHGAFAQAGEHFSNCGNIGIWCDRHPYHAGDLPLIFSDANGAAVMGVYLDKTNSQELSGRTVVLHSRPDDFKTQPSGNSGMRIACGVLAETL